MTDDEHDNFTAGDDVILYVERRHVRGKVVKVTAARVTVDYDGQTEVFHRRKWGRPFGCRRVTAADLAREAWEAAIVAWKRACPELKRFRVRFQYGDTCVSLDSEATLDALEQIAEEANAIREWLRKRPVEPSCAR